MNEKPNQPSQSSPDEIDLGQVFQLIGKGFDRLFRWILRVFLYLKKHAVWLLALVVIGSVLGYGLSLIQGTKQKLDVIVTPNFETKNYLFDAIAEIQADIKSKDTAFLASIGMSKEDAKGFDVEITPLKSLSSAGLKTEMEFLELLKDFENTQAIADIIRAELQDKTSRDHRITFYFKDPVKGENHSRSIIKYINSNTYYTGLLEVFNRNAQERIARNDSLVRQIDQLIENYTDIMLRERTLTEGRLVLENQEPLDIPSLLSLKSELIREMEAKRLELERRDDAITVVNFGKPYEVKKPIFKKNIFLIPLLLVGAYLIISILKYLDRKSRNL